MSVILYDSSVLPYWITTAPLVWKLNKSRGQSHERGRGIPCNGWFKPQRTFIPRESQCLSPRQNWPPHPTPASECDPPPHPRNQRGGGLQGKEHTRLWVRGWGSQYGRVEKNPRTLSILWFKRSMLSKSSNDQRNIKVGFFWIFKVLYSRLLFLRLLRCHCVGGFWDRTQDCCEIDTLALGSLNTETFFSWRSLSFIYV